MRQPSPLLPSSHQISCLSSNASGIEPLSTNHILHYDKSLIAYGSEGRLYSIEPTNFAEYLSDVGPTYLGHDEQVHLPEVTHRDQIPNRHSRADQGLGSDLRDPIQPDCTYSNLSGGKVKATHRTCGRIRRRHLSCLVVFVLLLTIIFISLASTNQFDGSSSSDDPAVSNSSIPGASEALDTPKVCM